MPNRQNPNNNLNEQILRSTPSASTASLVVSEWLAQGRYNDVVKACLDLLRLYPDDINLRRTVCLAYSALDLDREALKETEEIIPRIDGFMDLYLLRAKILNRLNEKKKALEALGLYLAHRPGDEQGLSVLEELKQSPQGLEHPGKEHEDAELDPAFLTASATIAELYLSQGLLDEAVKTYRHVVARNPDDEKSRRRLQELETQAHSTEESERPPAEAASGPDYLTVLERWREKCRTLFGNTLSPSEKGGIP